MVAVLEVTPEERPALAFVMARLIPMLRRDATEDREVADHLAFALHGLDQAPPGPGEIEFVSRDLYALGIHLYAVGVDLEEYWLDRVELARGRPPAEETDPDVRAAADRYFPEIAANPEAWNFKQAEPALISLGLKLDALMTAESPRARGLYNKARAAINRAAVARRERNIAVRDRFGAAAKAQPAGARLPAAIGAAHGEHQAELEQRPRRPVGTAVLPARAADPHLSVLSRATYPPQYLWGVETPTGIMAAELEPNKPVKLNLGGAQLMLVLVDGQVCAVSRICTHRAWDLSSGTVKAGVITCGLHGAQYEVCSGAVVRGPFSPEFNREHALLGGVMAALDPKKTCEALTTYPTRVAENGEILIHV
jgi:nitrite reductase/ring-hydroxylating ferredoxin subunit